MEIQQKGNEFFIEVEGKKALLQYNVKGKKMDIFYTFTDPYLRGKGLAEKLTMAAFRHAKKKGYKVIPTCDYVRDTFLKKHKEMNKLVAVMQA